MGYCVYVLQSERDGQLYAGYTYNLKKRLIQHNNGEVKSTKNRTPFKLVYYEFGLNKKDSIKREKYLKTSWGKRYIKRRLDNYLTG